MKTIEIITAQKVDISYTLAGLLQRILAFVIDSIIMYVVLMILVFIMELLIPNKWGMQDTYIYLVLSPIIFFYHLLFEYFNNGQSAGKKALGVRVVKANGERPEFVDYLTRWIFRIVDITFSLGIFATVAILASEKRQRLGDIIANTAVIQVQSARNYSLKDVMNVMRLKDYQVTYPEAKGFTEAQMLLVKETLERHKKNPNDEHIIALKLVAKKIANYLEVTKIKNTQAFLKVVLRDYIYLTR